ncbi:MAG: hypothetical protein QM741_12660 [Rudaea sp.]|uniref:hypothetical protein n=1 Tax=Rudaea sp. TaxID=2136325 RepID=UPI0039E44C73
MHAHRLPAVSPFALTVLVALLATGLAAAADVTIKPAAGGGVAITDASGANARLRVAETGEVWIPVLAAGAQQTSPVCSGAGGQLGPCAANAGDGSYTAATGLTLTGTTFAVAPPYQLPQGCAANQVPQWTGAAWACAAMSGGGSGFALPYVQTASRNNGALFSLTNTGDQGAGLEGIGDTGPGVLGSSNAAGGAGVLGSADYGSGVHGYSKDGYGVNGENDSTTGGAGVYGLARHSGDGLHGESTDGNGVYGKSANGYAMNADGPATQARGAGGWVKAMAFVHWDGGVDYTIERCFNSQLAAAQASTAPCGMSAQGVCSGEFCEVHVHFGFDLSDRFANVVQFYNAKAKAAKVIAGLYAVGASNDPDAVVVNSFDLSGSDSKGDFMVFVY